MTNATSDQREDDPYRDEMIVAKILKIQEDEPTLCIGGPLNGLPFPCPDGSETLSYQNFTYKPVRFYCAHQKVFMLGRFFKLDGLSDSDATTLLMKLLFGSA